MCNILIDISVQIILKNSEIKGKASDLLMQGHWPFRHLNIMIPMVGY